jgi:hypothetical protein
MEHSRPRLWILLLWHRHSCLCALLFYFKSKESCGTAALACALLFYFKSKESCGTAALGCALLTRVAHALACEMLSDLPSRISQKLNPLLPRNIE